MLTSPNKCIHAQDKTHAVEFLRFNGGRISKLEMRKGGVFSPYGKIVVNNDRGWDRGISGKMGSEVSFDIALLGRKLG